MVVETRRSSRRALKKSQLEEAPISEDSINAAIDGGEEIEIETTSGSDNESTSIRSPYRHLRQQLEAETEDDGLRENLLRRRQDTGRNKSRSRSRSPARRVTPRISPKTTPIVQNHLIESSSSRRTLNQEQTSSACDGKLVSLCMLLIIIVGLGVIINFYPNTMQGLLSNPKPTYRDVLKEYKSNLPNISISVIETAIENYVESKNPVPLLLYGSNETIIREFYLKLAHYFVRSDDNSSADQLILSIDQLKNKNVVISNLSKNGIILFDGIENLNAKDYMQLYGFVDEADSLVKDCLIVMSLHSKNKIDFTSIDRMDHYDLIENHARTLLRERWSSLDKNNLEALLNRIVSFVAYVS